MMKHRQTAGHRLLLNPFSNEIGQSYTHVCTKFPRKEIASTTSEGSKLNYKRWVRMIIHDFVLKRLPVKLQFRPGLDFLTCFRQTEF